MYKCIFQKPKQLEEIAGGTIDDASKRMDATCKAFSASHKCEGEKWIEDMTSRELPMADWPYSLKEANMAYSGETNVKVDRKGRSNGVAVKQSHVMHPI